MKRLLTFFTLSLVLVACETQPVGVDTPDAQFAKGDKPDHPRKPASGESITFTGDLIGNQEVAGCCPNAGPNPEYTMIFSEETFPEISGEKTGNIFMNSWSPKGTDYGDYIVQFCWGEEQDNHYLIEIRGGEKEYNKRTKILNVTFDQDNIVEWAIWRGTPTDHKQTLLQEAPPKGVYFTLTREPIG